MNDAETYEQQPESEYAIAITFSERLGEVAQAIEETRQQLEQSVGAGERTIAF